jgi:phosphoglycolate phosphatase
MHWIAAVAPLLRNDAKKEKMNLNLKNYKAIIFDWDGTLVDTCGLILDAHNHVRKHYNVPLWTMNDFLGRASKSAREYYPEIYGDKAEEAQIVLYEFVADHHLKYLKAMSQVEELCDVIKVQNIPMALVSNKRHDFLHKEVDVMGWRDYFSSIIGAGHAARDKPAIDPLVMAMAEISPDLKAADILYIGDTETDLLTAQNAGAPNVFIQSDQPRPDLIEKYAPNYAFLSISELLDAVTNHAEDPKIRVSS